MRWQLRNGVKRDCLPGQFEDGQFPAFWREEEGQKLIFDRWFEKGDGDAVSATRRRFPF